MRKSVLILMLAAGMAATVPAAQAQRPALALLSSDPNSVIPADTAASRTLDVVLSSPVARPQMSPELALQTHERRSLLQGQQLAAYSDTTVITASLLDTRQQGEYELLRSYAAPNTLKFKPVRFTGDSFVKANVIVRLLQAEADAVAKGTGAAIAVNSANYKFDYKGTEQIDGQPVYVFNVKPRRKLPGLFKGKIYLNPFSGALRRAQGKLVKSPSFFIKKVEFVQDYAEIGDFNLLVSVRSDSKIRILGRALLNIEHRDYAAMSHAQLAATAPAGVPAASFASQ